MNSTNLPVSTSGYSGTLLNSFPYQTSSDVPSTNQLDESKSKDLELEKIDGSAKTVFKYGNSEIIARPLNKLELKDNFSAEDLFYVVTFDDFTKTAKYKNLQRLSLDFSGLPKKIDEVKFSSSFLQLKGLPIEVLKLKSFKFLCFLGEVCEALPNLKKISIQPELDIGEYMIRDLTDFRYLEEITISDGNGYYPCNNFNFQGLKNCPSLKALRLETATALNEDRMKAIREALPNVEVVNIVTTLELHYQFSRTALNEGRMKAIRGALPNVQAVNIVDLNSSGEETDYQLLSSDNVAAISKYNLKKLQVDFCDIDSSSPPHKTFYQNIRQSMLQLKGIEELELKSLKNLGFLPKIHAALPNLKKISLVDIGSYMISYLTKFELLEKVTLGDEDKDYVCSSSDTFAYLKNCPSLKALVLETATPLNKDRMKAIRKVLPGITVENIINPHGKLVSSNFEDRTSSSQAGESTTSTSTLSDFTKSIESSKIIADDIGSKAAVPPSSHAQMKNHWLDQINNNQAGLGVISPILVGDIRYLTNEHLDIDLITHLSFDHITYLHSISVGGEEASVIFQANVVPFKNLKSLALDENQFKRIFKISPINILDLCWRNNEKLEKLTYRYEDLDTITQVLPIFSNLKTLILYCAGDTRKFSLDKKLLDYSNLHSSVEELHYQLIRPDCLSAISKYKLLKKLHLDFSSFVLDKSFYQSIIQLKGLPVEELELKSLDNLFFLNKIHAALPKLKKISLVDIRNKILSDLIAFQQLEEITIRDGDKNYLCGGSVTFECFEKCPSLKILRLETATPLNKDRMKAIRDALPGKTVVNIVNPNSELVSNFEDCTPINQPDESRSTSLESERINESEETASSNESSEIIANTRSTTGLPPSAYAQVPYFINNINNNQLGPNLHTSIEELHYEIHHHSSFTAISKYKNLKKLHLDFSWLPKGDNAESVSLFRKTEELKGLPIEELELKAFSLQYLYLAVGLQQALPNVRKISLFRIDLIDWGLIIPILQEFKYLEEITIDDMGKFHPCDIQHSEGLKSCLSLKTLRLKTATAVNEARMQAIRKALPGITVVNIVNTNVLSQHNLHITNNTNSLPTLTNQPNERSRELESKGVAGRPNSDSLHHQIRHPCELATISTKNKLLKKLHLDFCLFPKEHNQWLEKSIIQLQGLPINELELKSLEISYLLEKIQKALPNLKQISLIDIKINESNSIISDLKSFQYLKEITIVDGDKYRLCDNFNFQGLEGCRSLKTLRLKTATALKKDRMKAIREMLPNVHVMNICSDSDTDG